MNMNMKTHNQFRETMWTTLLVPLTTFVHQTLQALFCVCLHVGGMPRTNPELLGFDCFSFHLLLKTPAACLDKSKVVGLRFVLAFFW